MGAFEYRAIDPGGKERKGLLEGDTARHVRQVLREMNLLPLQVTEVAQRESKQKTGFTVRRGLSAGDLALITRQIATLVRSGLPLDEALQAVGEQNEKPRPKSILMGVRSRVMEGHTLASGLSDFPQAFPEIYRATVDAGEQSGHLDAVLERLADYTESRQVLRQKISHALIYPVILSVMAILIVVGLLVGVVPKVVGVFDNIGQELPWLTRALIASSDFVRDNGVWLAIGIVAAAAAARYVFRQPGPRRKLHGFLLRIPVVGKLVRGLNTARFARTLSILAGSGVPVLDALRIAGEVVVNIPMREAIFDAASRIREGAPIGKSLAVSKLFPPMTIHLISSGEASGELEDMLDRAAGNQEREMDSLINGLMSAMEPALIMMMGAMVLVIVLAILMPIFELNNLVK